MQPLKNRRDPAPSVLRYRLQRLWLTPSFRKFLSIAPPVLVLLGCAIFLFRSTETQQRMLQASIDIRDAFVGRREFRVSEMQISGASEVLRASVPQLAGVELPISSLDINVSDIRDRLEALPSVSDAAVRVGPGGVLQIDLSERVPALVWRKGNELKVVDQSGVILGAISTRLDRPDLPLILGAGAQAHVEEAVDILSIFAPAADELRGLQRVGGRRWNIVLENNRRVFLPEHSPRSALRRLMALDHVDNVFERDFKIIDLRDGKKPVLRLGDFAADEMRRLKSDRRGDGE